MQGHIKFQTDNFGGRGKEIKLSYQHKNTTLQAIASLAWVSCLLVAVVSLAKKMKRAFNC